MGIAFRAKETAGSHRVRRSLRLKSVSRVGIGAVGVVDGQQLGLLDPWMNSPRPGDPPGAAAPQLLVGIVGNASGVQRRPRGVPRD
jgi:hypothetical protein